MRVQRFGFYDDGTKCYGDDEECVLYEDYAALERKFKRCDEERAMANRQTEKFKGMWQGQYNRAALLNQKIAVAKEAIVKMINCFAYLGDYSYDCDESKTLEFAKAILEEI